MKHLGLAIGSLVLALHGTAGAVGAVNTAFFTEPVMPALQRVSAALDAKAYRLDAARLIYEAYATRIFKGHLPPLIHAVVVVETTVDAAGRALDVKVVRGRRMRRMSPGLSSR